MATILIVEDEDSLRETLARFLRREGHEVIAVSNGREAFDDGVPAAPNLLIVDWMLKDHLHGLHVSEALKTVDADLHTILITGFPSQDLLDESDRCGVLQLLEKPFDLQDLQEAVERALEVGAPAAARNRPVAVLDLDDRGGIRFANERARELLRSVGAEAATRLEDVLSGEPFEQLAECESDWRSFTPTAAQGVKWLGRVRRRPADGGWLLVLLPEDEQSRSADPRIRILLEHRSRRSPILHDQGPVVVIERDGAVRRLLVSQVERIGALCYPTDDLEAALRLLAAEPRASTVLIDFALAGDQMAEWVEMVKSVRPEACVIGTGGEGSEEDLLAQGVTRVLPKPWRIMDLLDAVAH